MAGWPLFVYPDSAAAQVGPAGSRLHPSLAVLACQRDVVDLLLSQGANADQRDSRGITPWAAAAATGQSELCSLLESKGAQASPQSALVLAAMIGNCDEISALIGLGAKPDERAKVARDRVTPLEAAFESNEMGRYGVAGDAPDEEVAESLRCQVMEALLSEGADPDTRNGNGRPLLLRAVDMIKEQVIPLLLRHGADVDITDNDGNTALLVAAQQGKVECAKNLLLGGADPNSANRKGQVAFMQMCVDYGAVSVDLAKLLVAFGAQLNVSSKAGKTIRQYAKRALSKARKDEGDTESITAVLELLDDEETLSEFAGAFEKPPESAEDGFDRANCALLWLEDVGMAVEELAHAVSMDATTLGRVVNGLDNDNWVMRFVAAQALGKIGTNATSAIPCLAERLGDEDEDVAAAAVEALCQIDGDGTKALLDHMPSLSTEVACRAAVAACRCDTALIDQMTALLKERLPSNEQTVEGQAAFDAATIHGALGDLHLLLDDYEAAGVEYEASVQLDPNLQHGRWAQLAQLKATLGDESFLQAIEHYSAGQERSDCGDFEGAEQAYHRAIDAAPDFPWGYNNLAWQLATCANSNQRDGEAAIRFARRASEMTGDRYHGILDTLAAAYAESGDFKRAAEIQVRTVQVAPEYVREEYKFNLWRYRSAQPWIEYGGAEAEDVEAGGGCDD